MASTTALFTGLSGLQANARSLDVIGNNISNVNTTAFKSSRMLFSPVMPRTLRAGTAPGDTNGGTNPLQVGLGVSVAGIQRDFRPGSTTATGDPRDLAIEGDGLFIVDRDGDQVYTRAGSFRQNSEGDLTSISGERLLGYAVDADYTLVSGVLAPINIPLGSATIAEATSEVRFSGNLNADGALPTQGARIDLFGVDTTGFSLISTATPAPGPGNLIDATSRLVDIEDPILPGTDTPIFSTGQTLELSGAEKGTKALPDAQLAIDDTTTVADLMSFLVDALGIHTGFGDNPDGRTPGLALDATTGVLTITGNTGAVNDLSIDDTDFRLLDSAGDFVRNPFVADKAGAADGESVRTSFLVYDSLGTPLTVDLSMVIDAKSNAGTTWRYFVESADDTDLALQVATGTLDFDTAGRLDTTDPVPLQIDRAATGAATPLEFDLVFDSESGQVMSLTDDSAIAAVFQDGAPTGTLTAFNVAADGLIVGTFTNGLQRTLGQVALATFTNVEGLVDLGDNLFTVGPNSGTPVVTTPGGFGTGRLVSGALELSNVDLGQEFINLILASTGYSASSRVIRTTDELLQQLLVLGR